MGFSKLHNSDYDEIPRRIGVIAWGIYTGILRYADASGEAFPHVETLASDLKLSCKSVQRGLKTLKDEGLITVQKTRIGNKYTLISRIPTDCESLPQRTHSPVPTDSQSIPKRIPTDSQSCTNGLTVPSPKDSQSVALEPDPSEEDLFKKNLPNLTLPEPVASVSVSNPVPEGQAGRQVDEINLDWRQRVQNEMQAIGVQESKAHFLAFRPDMVESVIRDQIDALPFRSANDPAAILVKSLQGVWALPEAFTTHRETVKTAARAKSEGVPAWVKEFAKRRPKYDADGCRILIQNTN